MESDASADLNARPSESFERTDTVDPQIISANGLVAILDALGTKLFSLPEAIEFIRLRDSIMAFTENVVETKLPGLEMKRLKKFTFNDTVVLAYEPPKAVTLAEVERFCHVLRVFETHAIVKNTPFRGALGIGEFYMGDKQTILGPAISDAASWYESSDWIGIHATPHATIFIQSLLGQSPQSKLDHVLVDYPVPLRDKSTLNLKAVNWPKGFYVGGLRPAGEGKTKGLVLAALAKRRMPKDTELKYFHAIEFFDYVEKTQGLENEFGVVPSRAAPGTS